MENEESKPHLEREESNRDRGAKRQKTEEESTPFPPGHSNVFVGNLPTDANESTLSSLFSSYGTIESMKVMVDVDTNLSKGFGFVKYSSVEEGNLRKKNNELLTYRSGKGNRSSERGIITWEKINCSSC